MFYHLLDIVRPYGVEHVKSVLAVRLTTLGVVVRKVDQNVGVLPDERPDLLDGDLVELWDVDAWKHRHLEELLCVREHQLEKVFVHHTWRWNIELYYNMSGHCGFSTYDTLKSSG